MMLYFEGTGQSLFADSWAFVVRTLLGPELNVSTDAEKNCWTAWDVSDWASDW